MMNSISSWCGGLLSGVCAESSLSSCRYPPYVIRSRKSVTTLSARDMGDLLPARSVCPRAARCGGGACRVGTDAWVAGGPSGSAFVIVYAYDRDKVNRAMDVSRSRDRRLTSDGPKTLQHDVDPNLVMDKETLTADPLDA